MSIDVISSVWKHSKQRGTALLMLIAIADNANEYGEAWPGIDYLAEKCRMKRRNAQLLIKELEDSGELVVARQEGKDTPHGKTNLYTIVTPGALTRHGVQSSTPHAERDAKLYTRGVQNSVSRDAEGYTPGVQGSTPKPSVEPSRTVSGGVARESENAAAAVESDTGKRLRKDHGFSDRQIRDTIANATYEFTPVLFDQFKAWRKVKDADPRVKSSGGLLASILTRGGLPDDLPPPPEPELTEEEKERRYWIEFYGKPVHASDYR